MDAGLLHRSAIIQACHAPYQQVSDWTCTQAARRPKLGQLAEHKRIIL